MGGSPGDVGNVTPEGFENEQSLTHTHTHTYIYIYIYMYIYLN